MFLASQQHDGLAWFGKCLTQKMGSVRSKCAEVSVQTLACVTDGDPRNAVTWRTKQLPDNGFREKYTHTLYFT